MMDTDILIVGAGPTGLMLANQLGRRGVRAMIIDRHSGPAQQTRAMAVHARTLEIYAKLGIARQALELGERGVGANMWAGGELKAHIPIGDMGEGLSPFPFVLMLGQDDNERIMGEKLRDWRMAVEWSTELVGLEQQADRVVATIKQPNGVLRKVTAAWVAGCDGSRSPVREFCGITFPGAPYEHAFFVADTVAIGEMAPHELNVYLWKQGFHLFFPMRGKDQWRVIGILPESLGGRSDVSFRDVIPQLREVVGDKLSFKECHWFSIYRIHHRAASRFRNRRCFLLGDAAHVHSPMGGQGMNTGLQDAYNLAWKLAMVVKGEADESLLDSYEAERMPVAHQLLDSTDRMFTAVVKDNWVASLFRRRIIANMAALAMRSQRIRRLAFHTISQIGIRYRSSPLSRTLNGVTKTMPQAGDRFPWLQLKLRQGAPVEDLFAALDDTRFNLIVIGQPEAEIAQTLSGLARIHIVPLDAVNESALAEVKVSQPCFYLLRPDGHIGLAGGHFDAAAVMRYLADMRLRAGAMIKKSAEVSASGVERFVQRAR